MVDEGKTTRSDIERIRSLIDECSDVGCNIKQKALRLNARGLREEIKNPEGEKSASSEDIGLELQDSLRDILATLRDANEALKAFAG